jgi:arsenate reductase (thioredoxin)
MSATAPLRLLFVCRQNARRSQIAHGWLQAKAGDRVVVESAGLDQAGGLAPEAITVMAEWGIDLSRHTSTALSAYRAEDFDAVISLCGCLEELPPQWRQRPIAEEWAIADPHAGDLPSHRAARDAIAAQVETLLIRLEREQWLPADVA